MCPCLQLVRIATHGRCQSACLRLLAAGKHPRKKSPSAFICPTVHQRRPLRRRPTSTLKHILRTGQESKDNARTCTVRHSVVSGLSLSSPRKRKSLSASPCTMIDRSRNFQQLVCAWVTLSFCALHPALWMCATVSRGRSSVGCPLASLSLQQSSQNRLM